MKSGTKDCENFPHRKTPGSSSKETTQKKIQPKSTIGLRKASQKHRKVTHSLKLTANAPWKLDHPKRKGSSSNHPCSVAKMLNFGRVSFHPTPTTAFQLQRIFFRWKVTALYHDLRWHWRPGGWRLSSRRTHGTGCISTTPRKTNGWVLKIILALEKVDSGVKYGHVWYLCEISGVMRTLKKQVKLFCFIATTYILHHILYSPYWMANGIGLPFGIAGEIQKSPFRIRLKSSSWTSYESRRFRHLIRETKQNRQGVTRYSRVSRFSQDKKEYLSLQAIST